MFRSNKRPIIIPQYEHGRMAGYLAQNYGNGDFDRPTLDFESFVQGVALHDWHYGFADNWSITDLDEETWVRIAHLGQKMRLQDPISEIVSKMHLCRLITYGPTSPERQELIKNIDQQVADRLPETGHNPETFVWADKITRLCDFVVFHFAFEEPYENKVMVCPRVESDQETAITYHIIGDGQVNINPWPFAVPSLSGIIIGYEAQEYPLTLTPVVVPFRISSGNV